LCLSKVGNEDNSGWLTPSTRKVASGSPGDKAEEKLRGLGEDLKELEEKREDHQENLEKIQNLKQEKQKFEEKRAETTEKLNDQRAKKGEWAEFREVEKKAEKAEKRCNQFYGAKNDWDDKVEKIGDTLKKMESIKGKTNEHQDKQEETKQQEKQLREKFENGKTELEELKEKKGYLERLRAFEINKEINSLNGGIISGVWDLEKIKPHIKGKYEKIVEKDLNLSMLIKRT